MHLIFCILELNFKTKRCGFEWDCMTVNQCSMYTIIWLRIEIWAPIYAITWHLSLYFNRNSFWDNFFELKICVFRICANNISEFLKNSHDLLETFCGFYWKLKLLLINDWFDIGNIIPRWTKMWIKNFKWNFNNILSIKSLFFGRLWNIGTVFLPNNQK